MPKTKKVKKEKLKVESFVVESPITEERPKVSPFSLDFGREDLNQLKDKLNEVIEFINK